MSRPLYAGVRAVALLNIGVLAIALHATAAAGATAAASSAVAVPVRPAAAVSRPPDSRPILGMTEPQAAARAAAAKPVAGGRAPAAARTPAPRRPAAHRRPPNQAGPHTGAAAPRPRAAVRPTRTPTWSAALSDGIAAIPGDGPAAVRWVVSDRYGSWGTADWYHDTVYISPRTPRARLYDVVVHEWSHLLSVRAYGGDVDAAVQAMNEHFGGTGLTGAERAADCMARIQHATWTSYTPCTDSRWRTGAARLLAGGRL